MVSSLLFRTSCVMGLEPIQMQQSGGLLLPPVQKLVATIIFANGENANRVPFGVPEKQISHSGYLLLFLVIWTRVSKL